MAIENKMVDGHGDGHRVRVSKWGIAATGPIEFSVSYPVTASSINTAYTFVGPKAGKQFVVTDILLYANKNVGANDATVEIYEADTETTTTVSKSVLITEMLKQTSRDFVGLNLVINEGKWLNIKTDDATIFASVLGYYVPVV
ncbi:MAG: hypothetical protein GTO02_14250 [Candidatus Dadabacteria bacterium]|nr:hypothetical protein [Candidatus Dadabacteria bacterium]